MYMLKYYFETNLIMYKPTCYYGVLNLIVVFTIKLYDINNRGSPYSVKFFQSNLLLV